jgi:integrase
MAELQQMPADAALARRLQTAALQAPTWDVQDDAQFLDTRTIDFLLEKIRRRRVTNEISARDPLVVAALALLLGQRAGDVQNLRTEDVYLHIPVSLATTQQKVTIQFTEHKMKRKGPYTLAIPADSIAGQFVRAARASATLLREVLLFEQHSIHGALERIKIACDIRSLRRTGLSRLANAGVPLEVILSISRHSSVAMLERYLANGLRHGHQHEQMMNGFTLAWEHTLPRII